MLYLTVRFDSLKVSALIDSGSSENIISKQLYNSLLYSQTSAFNSDVHDSIVLANNHKVEVVGTAMIKMNISGTNQRIFTYILKLSLHPIILGTNYLIENKLVLDFSELCRCTKNCERVLLEKDHSFTEFKKQSFGVNFLQIFCLENKEQVLQASIF